MEKAEIHNYEGNFFNPLYICYVKIPLGRKL